MVISPFDDVFIYIRNMKQKKSLHRRKPFFVVVK